MGLVALLATVDVFAAEKQTTPASPTQITSAEPMDISVMLRFVPFMCGIRSWRSNKPFLLSGEFPMVLGSLALQMKWIEIEAGGGYYAEVVNYPSAKEAFGRVGIMPRIWGSNLTTKGWVLRVGVLTGYHYMTKRNDHEDNYYNQHLHAWNFTAALDITYWFADHFGLNFRLTPSFSVPFAWKILYADDPEGMRARFTFGLFSSIGFAF